MAFVQRPPHNVSRRRLSPELRQRVRQRWAAFYKDFGYPLDEEEEAVADR